MSEEQPYISVKSGKTDRSRYPLQKRSVLVGREPACDICLASAELSPIHLMLQRGERGYILVRQGSNPVFVNGKETVQSVLKDSDEIRIASFVLEYHAPGSAGVAPRPLPGQESRDQGAVGPKGSKTKSLLMSIVLFVYLPIMAIIIGAMMFRSPDALYAPLSQRLEDLDTAYQNSQLVEQQKNEVAEMVREAISQEMRVRSDLTVERLQRALNATIDSGSNPYRNPELLNDPLRVFIREEIDRQNTMRLLGVVSED
jgi:hypothetical protein